MMEVLLIKTLVMTVERLSQHTTIREMDPFSTTIPELAISSTKTRIRVTGFIRSVDKVGAVNLLQDLTKSYNV